ncbi:MAG: protein phosphatase 2C domain-containing protein [Symploca sp. SIO2G7]|nr:protein phosphatase 2C domain-containing protein [Symploca sp. SIO2G7]
MVRNKEPKKWHILKSSVQGASHKRKGLVNQDAIQSWQEEGSETGLPLILAISDGHGSAKSFRSDQGSSLAVATAVKILQGFVDEESDRENLSAVKAFAQEQLPKRLVSTWRQKVEDHIQENPFRDEELTQLETQEDSSARQKVESNNLIAYGATILSVLVTQDYILYLQLGDGDIFCVDTFGETERPLRTNENLIANETTSLCTKEAWRNFDIEMVRHSESPPKMILVATDGYANSYPSEQEFLKIGNDYLGMIRQLGRETVKEQLENILERTSQGGSGDDITLGIIKPSDGQDLKNRVDEVEDRQDEVEDRQDKLDEKCNRFADDFEQRMRRVEQMIDERERWDQENESRYANIKSKQEENAAQNKTRPVINIITVITMITISIVSSVSITFWLVKSTIAEEQSLKNNRYYSELNQN